MVRPIQAVVTPKAHGLTTASLDRATPRSLCDEALGCWWVIVAAGGMEGYTTRRPGRVILVFVMLVRPHDKV